MEDYSIRLIKALQEKIPTANIYWETASNPFFNKKSCILAAVDKSDPSKKTSMEFTNGLSDDHTIKDVVDGFITHCGRYLK